MISDNIQNQQAKILLIPSLPVLKKREKSWPYFLTLLGVVLTLKHRAHKMIKHTHTIRRQFAEELFECV